MFVPIEGYEGLYSISKEGEVMSMKREVTVRGGGKRVVKQKLIRKYIQNNGYLCVHLSKEGKTKNYLLHRLIAIAFIKGKPGRNYINHKNGVKTDNRIENLERCTFKENRQHAFHVLGYNHILDYAGHPEGKEHFRTKIVQQLNKEGEVIAEYWGCSEASRKTGIHRDGINHVINGRHKTAGGYIWKYK